MPISCSGYDENITVLVVEGDCDAEMIEGLMPEFTAIVEKANRIIQEELDKVGDVAV